MERDMMSLAPTSHPDATDACGCTPHTPMADDVATIPDQLAASAPPAPATSEAGSVRRALKLVVTLTPTEGGQYRAALAIGAVDCDPVLRSATVPGLTVALELVPALLAEAEARWRLDPRNPATARPTARRFSADHARPAMTPPPAREPEAAREAETAGRAEREPSEPPPTDPAVTPKRPTGGQLTLFS